MSCIMEIRQFRPLSVEYHQEYVVPLARATVLLLTTNPVLATEETNGALVPERAPVAAFAAYETLGDYEHF